MAAPLAFSEKWWTISVLESAARTAVFVAVAGIFPVRSSAQLAGELEVEGSSVELARFLLLFRAG